jgi:hypothetical protein
MASGAFVDGPNVWADKVKAILPAPSVEPELDPLRTLGSFYLTHLLVAG